MASRLQKEFATFDNVTNMADAFTSNVTAGSLIVVSAARWRSSDSTLYLAGGLTKSAGTATIDTPVLEYSASPGSEYVVGQWSCLVTGGGSLTLQVAHPFGGTYGSVGMAEYSGTWDSSRTEDTASNTGTSTAADSGNATSAGAAVFIGSMSSTNLGNVALTEDGAYLLIGEDQRGDLRAHHSMIEQIVGSGTTDAASWTIGSSSAWAAAVIVFKEAGGGGGGAANSYYYRANQ